MSNKEMRARVTVTMRAVVYMDEVDSGYLGTDSSVAEHIKHAREATSNWQVLIKQYNGTPKPVGVKWEVESVTIVPDKA